MPKQLLAAFAAIGFLSACAPSSSAPGAGTGAEAETVNLARCSQVEFDDHGDKAVPSWSTAPSDALITPPLLNMSVRQFFAPHWPGEVVRMRLSNRYSSVPLTLQNLRLAEQDNSATAAVVEGSDCLLTFGGESTVTIGAGETVLSDAIVFPVTPFKRLGISFLSPEFAPQLTRHLAAVETPYISIPGDHTADPAGTAYVPAPIALSNNFLVIEALEVAATPEVSTVVAIGDSITDGASDLLGSLAGLYFSHPSLGKDERYPNFLAKRFLEAGLPFAVSNKGIGGNRLLSDGIVPQYGPPIIERYDYDALEVPSVSHVLMMIGTNDSGTATPQEIPSTEAMIAGYTDVIERSHAAGVKIILGTIPPAKGMIVGELPAGLSDSFGIMHGMPQAEVARNEVNDWIRSQTLSDGVVDFYACLEDPNNPGYLLPEYNSGDNLHPSAAGYAAMADCIDLELFY
jgi:lysophospholipase L1-like esterase